MSLDGVCPHRLMMWNIAGKSFFSNSRLCNLYVRVRGSSRVRQGALCGLCRASVGPVCSLRTKVRSLCGCHPGRWPNGGCDSNIGDRTEAAGRVQGEGAWSGDAVLVYVDYSELCIVGLISFPTALFVDCLQGEGICP